jgi:hypothetical protein
MRILCILFVALAPLASAQSLANLKGLDKQPQKFDFPKPFSPAALRKAFSGQAQVLVLRGMIQWNKPGSAPFSGLPQTLLLPGAEAQDSKVCAVRLLEYKADASVDPGIQHPASRDADKDAVDRTPLRLPMPACPAQP